MEHNQKIDYRADELIARVQKSLQNFGLTSVIAECTGDRMIRLSGTVAQAEDRALAVAVALTVPGVRGATFDIHRNGCGVPEPQPFNAHGEPMTTKPQNDLPSRLSDH